jgi:hypothetical protein
MVMFLEAQAGSGFHQDAFDLIARTVREPFVAAPRAMHDMPDLGLATCSCASIRRPASSLPAPSTLSATSTASGVAITIRSIDLPPWPAVVLPRTGTQSRAVDAVHITALGVAIAHQPVRWKPAHPRRRYRSSRHASGITTPLVGPSPSPRSRSSSPDWQRRLPDRGVGSRDRAAPSPRPWQHRRGCLARIGPMRARYASARKRNMPLFQKYSPESTIGARSLGIGLLDKTLKRVAARPAARRGEYNRSRSPGDPARRRR